MMAVRITQRLVFHYAAIALLALGCADHEPCSSDEDCPSGEHCSVTGCAVPDDAPVDVDVSNVSIPVRLVHAAPGRASAAVYLGEDPISSMVAFGHTTVPFLLPPGETVVAVRGTGLDATEPVSLEMGATYTLVLFADDTGEHLLAVADASEGWNVVNVMDAFSVWGRQEGPRRLPPAAATPWPVSPQLALLFSKGDPFAVFDAGWAEGSTIVLTGAPQRGPTTDAGPRAIVADPSASAQATERLVWLARPGGEGLVVCDPATAAVLGRVEPDRFGTAGPFVDLPDEVAVGDSEADCGSAGATVRLGAGLRHIIFAGGTSPASWYTVGNEPPSTETAPRRYVLVNAGDVDLDARGLGTDVVVPVGVSVARDVEIAPETVTVGVAGAGPTVALTRTVSEPWFTVVVGRSVAGSELQAWALYLSPGERLRVAP